MLSGNCVSMEGNEVRSLIESVSGSNSKLMFEL